MKVVTIVGARPQFIKAAMVSKELKGKCEEILVHTGQHYDYNMSELFFEELEMEKPKYNLGISGGSHAQMTARMMMSIEEVLIREKPDCVLVYGDTNSTLASAITSSKMHIPIYHVEAGLRFHVMTNPEEINRICTDHVSTKLFACTENSMRELEREGLKDKALFVGDPMYDAFLQYSTKLKISDFKLTLIEGQKVSVPEDYYYMTCHREENTNCDSKLLEIMTAMNSLDSKTVYPVHPRNRDRASRIKKENCLDNILLTEPVGYFESLSLVNNAKKIVTDSGGLQREAFFAKKSCVTVLDFVVWPETMLGKTNQLAKPNRTDILKKLNEIVEFDEHYKPFGDGCSAKIISKEICRR